MVGNKERQINLTGVLGCTGADLNVLLLHMGVFDSKPLNTTPLNNTLRRNPVLFGASFVMIMVVASYALVPFTQTKYELQDRRNSKVRLNPIFCHPTVDFTRNLSGLERTRVGSGEPKEKVRYPRGILRKSPSTFLYPDPSDLPPACL